MRKKKMSGKMKTLVAFYSRTGNTRKVAEHLSKLLKCDCEEIVDAKNRYGIIGYLRGGKDAFQKNLTIINRPRKKPGKYELIILGTPVWASTMAPAIRTYIEKHKDGFGKMAFFCTMGGSGGKKAMEEMALITRKRPKAKMEFLTREIVRGEHHEKLSEFAGKLVGKKATGKKAKGKRK